ncbi:MAG TPA: TonB family protein [Pyrinomonadaceae bacterium]|nr:TonB family protein [Pyrinomonadaceae bacterium]
MKKKETRLFNPQVRIFIFVLIVQIFIVAAVSAQSTPASEASPSPANPASNGQANPASGQTIPGSGQPNAASATPIQPNPIAPVPITSTGASEAEILEKRLARARALAAAHQLPAAASEMESVRALVKDEVVRNSSRLMLMGIYLEDGNYARAESLLEETFKERSQKKEASINAYFALAGQAVNGARAHVARYRQFGINVTSQSMPPEATVDLDRLRSLLERMHAQGKDLVKENAKASDAFALLEDISGIRTLLAKDSEDRGKWETEHSLARARLATLPAEMASIGTVPAINSATNETATRSVSQSMTAAVGTPLQTEAAKGTPVASENKGASPVVPPLGSGALEVGSLVEKATNKVSPAYPQAARNAGISGLVRVKIVVDESGAVAGIVWAEGPMLLRQAAQDALRQWKFQPAMVDGKPVKSTGYVDFGFTR